jgi:hypothetical protein
MTAAKITAGPAPKAMLMPHLCALRFFDRRVAGPRSVPVDAAIGEEAIAIASDRNWFAVREVWDPHRLVAIIPAAH